MSSRPVLLLTALVALLTASCGGAAREATQKQLSELHSELVRLRAEHAVLTERLDNIEIARGQWSRGDKPKPGADGPDRDGSAPPRGAGADPDRPQLDVVRLGPDRAAPPNAPAGEAPAGDAEDTDSKAPRPVVQLSGDGRGSTPTVSKKSPSAKANPKKKQQP